MPEGGKVNGKTVDKLLAPDSIAVVGASPNLGTWSGQVLESIKRFGFAGALYAVNPKYTEINGTPCYASIQQIPQPVDAAILFVPNSRIPEVLEQCGPKGITAAIILASGYAEIGEEGRSRQDKIKEIAGRHGIRICGPNCLGIINVPKRILAYASPIVPEPLRAGGMAVVSQSGAITAAMLNDAHDLGIGLSYLISSGNEVDLEVSDYVDFLLEDASTKVIALLIESLKNPKKFLQVALLAREKQKPIIALKIGRSEAGHRAVLAHTGSFAGFDAAYRAIFRENGIIQVNEPNELFENTAMLMKNPPPQGPRLGIMTASGGWAGILADLCEDLGLGLATLQPDTVERLRSTVSLATPQNPFDIAGHFAEGKSWQSCLNLLLQDGNVDLLLLVIHQIRKVWRDPILESIFEARKRTDKPLVVFWAAGSLVEDGLRELVAEGTVPVFRAPRNCLQAIRNFLWYHNF